MIPSEKHLLLKKQEGGVKEEQCDLWLLGVRNGQILYWPRPLSWGISSRSAHSPASAVLLQFSVLRLSSVPSTFWGRKALKA